MSEGHPTPEKLRRVIVWAFHDESLSYAQIAHLLGIGEATVSRVLRLYRETGDFVPRPKGGGNFSPIRGKVLPSSNGWWLRSRTRRCAS